MSVAADFAAALRAEPSLETKRLVWTAAIVVGTSLPHWPTLSAWMPALLVTAVAWRFAIAVSGWRAPPRIVHRLLTVGALLGVLAQYRTLNGVEAGSALLVVMVALKFLESRGQRDQLVLIMISYFLLFASLLAERSPLAVAYAALLIWFTTVALLQIGRRGPLLPYRATAIMSGRLLLLAVPVMAVLFVLFPRLPGPLWALPGSTSGGATGLSDTMSPGDITNLGLSDEIAFRVEFESAVPRANDLYWRGPALANFNGRTWSMLGMRRGDRVATTIDYLGESTTYRVMLEPNGRNWAFALDMPREWSGDNTLRMGSDYNLGFFLGANPRGRRAEYRVTSHVEYRAREPLTPNEIETFRALPPGSNPRARALAESWLVDGPSPATIVERAMDYLRSQPFQYTLTPPPLGANPVDEFLFETREGFCEHYASALTFLLRAAGLPARVVLGYQGGELNALGGYYIIRQSDAHAWTEVWLEDEGWVRVDGVAAAAPERLALGIGRFAADGADATMRVLRPGLGRQAALLWDAVNVRWQSWVVGYGPEPQRALLGALGFEGLRRTERYAVLLGLTVAATLALLAAFSAYHSLRRRRRAPTDEATRCFARFVRKLERLGVPGRAPTEGPRAYAERAAQALPEFGARIRAIVDLYVQARYEPDAGGAALAELASQVAAFRGARAWALRRPRPTCSTRAS